MVKRIITLIFVITALSLNLSAEITAMKGKVSGGYNFWLSSPKSRQSDSIKEKPLIVFLHGASLCGNNLDKVRHYGTIDAIEKGRDIDAYVVAPQNPGGSWRPSKIMDVVEWVEKNYPIDLNRVYVIGMSLGGYGTLDFVATYHDRIAAAIALCGGATVKDLSGLDNVPLWIIHGLSDRAVSISQSDRVAEAIKSNGTGQRLIYDRVPGMNHGQPARILYMRGTYDWLLKHSLADENRTVAQGFAINQSALRSAYDGLNTRNGYQHKHRTKHRHKKR